MKPIGEKLVFDTSDPDDNLVLGSVYLGLLHASDITGSELTEEAKSLKALVEHKEEQGIVELSVREAKLALNAIYLRREFAIIHDSIGDDLATAMRYRHEIEAFAGEGVPVTVR